MTDGSTDGLDRMKKRMAVGLVLGLAVLAGTMAFGDAGSVIQGMGAISPRVIVLACLLSLGNYLTRFTKWHYYLTCLGERVPMVESLLVFLSGLSMSVTPGKLGEVLKSFLLRSSRGTELAKTMPVVVSERITDLFGLVLIMGIGCLHFAWGRTAFALLAVFSLAFVVVVRNRPLVEGFLDLVERIPKVGRIVPPVRTAYDSAHLLFKPVPLVVTILISAVSWGFEGYAFHLVLADLGLAVGVAKALFIYSAATLLGAVSMLPGGLGTAEGGLLTLLVREGASRRTAGVATLVIRLCTLWFAVLVGVVALGLWTRFGGLKDLAGQTETMANRL